MGKSVFAAALLLSFSFSLSINAFSQSSNASLGGIVNDASGAVIPGVTVTATNTATGIVITVISNDAGVYNFPSLLPGQYKVSAEQAGFQIQTFTDVQLGNAAQGRLNFKLQVRAMSESVEVSIAADKMLLESSSSVGQVLEKRHVEDLPLTSNNILDLANVMAGVTVTRSPIFAAGDTQFAGVSAANVNVQRDGVSVNGQRWPTGINSATELNPDLVGEVKMILAPVDAEMGRGSGQVQVQTRSGTNSFHGAAVWNVKNSALDANIWENNRTLNPLTGEPKAAPWRNVHQATLSLGGPIKKNKTYFFVLYDEKWSRMRQITEPLVLTPCARNGIFRYYDSWNNGNVLQVTQAAGATPAIAVVNRDGSPKAPATLPNGQPHNGILRYASVFGQLQNIPTKPDCSDAVVTGSSWDPYRTGYDPSGYVKNVLLKYMPPANAYDLGDGLNTAGSNWLQPLNGSDNLFGIGEPTERKQINFKLDHYFSEKHKISGTYSFEKNWADDSMGWWPDPFMGVTRKRPQVLAVNFTSTLRPTLLNEARFGVVRNGQNVFSPLYNLPTNQPLLDLLPKTSGGTTYAPQLGSTSNISGTAAALSYQSVIGARTFSPQVMQRDQTPRYQYGDSVTWMKGKHSFKFGGEFRTASSKATQSGPFPTGCGGDSTFPIACGGEIAAFSSPAGINATNMPGLAGSATTGNQDRAENLLNYLAGSLASIAQYRFINLPSQAGQSWNDPAKDPFRVRDMHQKEFGAFFKDDFKVGSNFTLNLGLRWDYYGPPSEENGLMATLKDAGAGLFGISGRGFDGWMKPGSRAGVSELIFVGPNSPNPGVNSYKRDLNNFGPAVGFAWNVDKQTVMRGGYQIQYIGGGGLTTIDTNFGNPPGSSTTAFYQGDTSTPYLNLTKVQSSLLPIKPVALPVQPIPVTDRTQTITAYDPNYVNPYIQNMTLSITRTIGSKLTVDVRYIGTLSRKQSVTWDINAPNYQGNGLLEAFNAARAGGESALLDQMFNGINIAGAGHGPVGTTVNGVLQTGAMHLRDTIALRTNLAMGNYVALANSVANLNYSTTFPGNQNLPFQPGNVNGTVLRYNGFPENFIKTNPQFSTANLVSNAGHSNYHSMQAQVTLRPTYGLSLQGSYTWSKNLTLGPLGFTDPRNQAADYTLSAQNRGHVLNSYGTYNLPFGPGQWLAGNTSGFVGRLIGGWQASWILNMSTGAPETITAQSMLYGRGTPDQVRPFDFTGQRGVVWTDGALTGSYFNYQLQNVKDPQCLAIAASLRSACTLQAVADMQGNIILQNAQPGKRGNVGLMTMETAGTWNADMALSKTFRITEGVRGTIRVDAKNIFNHPTPGIAASAFAASTAQFVGNINDTVNRFGALTTKGSAVPQSDYQDSRQFEFRLRLEF